MHPFPPSLLLSSIIPLISAATHNINVGNNLQTIESLVFTPNVTEAAAGDTVIFHFYPGDHDVVQGDFNTPCQPATAGGFYSGFIDSTSGEANRIFNITINDTAPIWLYCSQSTHCKSGMVGAINPPAGALNSYKAAAASVNSSVTPNVVAGGTVETNPNSTTSSSSTSGTATSTSTATRTGSSSTASSSSAASMIMSTESLEKIMSMVSLVALGAFMGIV